MKNVSKLGLLTSTLALGSLVLTGCGSDDSRDPASIGNSPSASASSSVSQTPSASASESPEASESSSASQAPSGASSASQAPSDDTVFGKKDMVNQTISDYVNGPLGPLSFNSMSADLKKLGVTPDDSVRDVFFQTTQTKLIVSHQISDVALNVGGHSSMTLDYTVVKGNALYRPGENEDDGGKRAYQELVAYYGQHKDMPQKHLIFTVTSQDGGKTASVSSVEK